MSSPQKSIHSSRDSAAKEVKIKTKPKLDYLVLLNSKPFTYSSTVKKYHVHGLLGTVKSLSHLNNLK